MVTEDGFVGVVFAAWWMPEARGDDVIPCDWLEADGVVWINFSNGF